jgi:molecular chaperone GrpE
MSDDAETARDADADADTDTTVDAATNGEPREGVREESTSDEDPEADREADDPGSTETGLAARVAEATDGDESLAAEVADLEARAADLEGELEETRSKLTRVQADFQNYKKRAKRKQEQIRERASEDLVERLVPVRDNLVRALDQEEGADIRPGVESTLTELDRVLEEENVTVVEPAPGDEVDPHRHEVMLRVDSDRPEGTVVDLYQPGYEMGGRVLRPAQVTVSEGDDGASEDA